MDYLDQNLDGQPDQNELPSSETILKKLSDGEKNGEDITSASGGTPTPEEIDARKNKLKSDPEQQSGVYTIVEKNPDGKMNVIEVFGVRDWEEKDKGDGDEPAILPIREEAPMPSESEKKPPISQENSMLNVPPPPLIEELRTAQMGEKTDSNTVSSSRFASSGLLVGSLWILRQATTQNEERKESDEQDLSTVRFSLRDRRRRKLISKLSN